MTTSKPSPLERFRDTIDDSLDVAQEIIVRLHKANKTILDPKVTAVASGFLKAMSPETLIDRFIIHTFSYWDNIHDKKRVFFVENYQEIFEGLPVNHLNAFGEMFKKEENMTKDEEDTIWEFFHSLVKTCIHYIHEIREPKTVDGQRAYSNSKFAVITVKGKEIEIKPTKCAKIWGITLTF